MDNETRPAILEDFEGLLADEHVGVFYGADKRFIEELAESGDCQVLTYQSGDDVFVQHQLTKNLPISIVIEGLFAIKHLYKDAESGKEKTLIVAFDGASTVLGDVEQLISGVPNELIPRGTKANSAKATITAMTTSKVLTVEGESRKLFLDSYSVSKQLNLLLALKILRRSARGDAIQLYEPWQVLAALIKRLVLEPKFGGVGYEERPKIDAKDWPAGYARLRCRIRQDDLADALGKSTVTVSTLFKRLETENIAAYKKEGLIYVSKKFISGEIPIRDDNDFWW